MQPTAPGEGVSRGWPPRAPAYHRARCASTSSPGPPSRSGSTSCGRSPSASSGSGWPGSAGAPPGSAATAGSASYRDIRAFRDDPGRETVGATETTSALVHLRRPSRLSTLTLPDTQPFDDPAGRFAFSHNGDLRDYKEPARDVPRRGPHPRPRRHRGRGALARGRVAAGRLRRLAAGGAPRAVRRAGQPRAPGRRRDAAPLRRQRREPRLRVPPRPDRHRVDRDLLARSLAVPVRGAGGHRPQAGPLAHDCHTRPRRASLRRQLSAPTEEVSVHVPSATGASNADGRPTADLSIRDAVRPGQLLAGDRHPVGERSGSACCRS